MQALVWARVPGDLVFAVGVAAFCLFMIRALFGGQRAAPAELPTADFAIQPAE
jgi:nitric oxide reductase subunit B